MKKMKITLHQDGTQKVEVVGAAGDECLRFSRELEQRLGTSLGERELKPEYYETESEVERQREVDR